MRGDKCEMSSTRRVIFIDWRGMKFENFERFFQIFSSNGKKKTNSFEFKRIANAALTVHHGPIKTPHIDMD
jgi:hypothetical protein